MLMNIEHHIVVTLLQLMLDLIFKCSLGQNRSVGVVYIHFYHI